MRHRTYAIQVRVTESEKQHICRNARRCGLNLSTYLRKLSLGKEVHPATPPALYRAYGQLVQLQQEWETLPPAAVAEQLQRIAQAMRQVCCHIEKEGDPQWQ